MSTLNTVGHIVVAPVLRAIWRPEIIGVEHVPRTGAVIVAGNHLSVVDSTLLPLATRREMYFLAKDEYFRRPVSRMLMRALNQIKVDRSGGLAGLLALDAALPILHQGKVLGIFPEGTRSPDGRLYRGRPGVAKLALDTGAPIIPAGLLGTDRIQPLGARFPRIARATVIFGKPLDLSPWEGVEARSKVYREITELLMHEIAVLTGQEYIGRYARRASA